MTEIHIRTMKPMLFENEYLVIGMEKRISSLFHDLTFEVSIVDGFLRIQSTEKISFEFYRR